MYLCSAFLKLDVGDEATLEFRVTRLGDFLLWAFFVVHFETKRISSNMKNDILCTYNAALYLVVKRVSYNASFVKICNRTT
jgi:hypothetical protein